MFLLAYPLYIFIAEFAFLAFDDRLHYFQRLRSRAKRKVFPFHAFNQSPAKVKALPLLEQEEDMVGLFRFLQLAGNDQSFSFG
jgi:hypothetical protein